MFEDSAEEAWRIRYGSDPPVLPDLGRFLNHRSVRKYSNEPIPEETMAGLIAAAQSASTSSHLQLWSVISVQDPERRAAITELCADQAQVRNAAWFLAFVADHHRLARAAAELGEQCAGLDYAEFFVMAVIDAALAAERLVCAAQSLGIGACYIGALRNDAAGVASLLQLPPQTAGLFGLTLGWPLEGQSADIKPRLAQEAVWHREVYAEADTSEFDRRMSEFYESQGMKAAVTWTMRSGRRVDEDHLTGRERLLQFLTEQGFLAR